MAETCNIWAQNMAAMKVPVTDFSSSDASYRIHTIHSPKTELFQFESNHTLHIRIEYQSCSCYRALGKFLRASSWETFSQLSFSRVTEYPQVDISKPKKIKFRKNHSLLVINKQIVKFSKIRQLMKIFGMKKTSRITSCIRKVSI